MHAVLFFLLATPMLWAQSLTLDWGTYLGSGVESDLLRHARDAAGNIYVAAAPMGPFYRSTHSPYVFGSAYIAKYDPTGAFLWGTYYRGSAQAASVRLAVDPAGNSYLTGIGGAVLSLDPQGNQRWLLNPGWLPQFFADLTIGPNGRIAVCGTVALGAIAGSTQFEIPATVPSLQNRLGGREDGLLLVLESTGQPVFATYYGGSGSDALQRCAYDSAGIVHSFVTTSSPTPFERCLIGFDIANRRRAYYGPLAVEVPATLLIHNNRLWIIGNTSSDLPVTPDAALRTPFESLPSRRNPFFARASLTGQLEYATFVGNIGSLTSLAISPTGDIAACGIADTAVWPVSPNAIESSPRSTRRVTVNLLNSRGEILHATYLNSRSATSTCHSASWFNSSLLLSGFASNTLFAVTNPIAPLSGNDRPNHWLVQLNLQPGNQPRFTSAAVTNAASFTSGPISPGEIITVFAQNAGPATLAGLQLTADRRVATLTGNTRLLFDGTPAPLIYSVSGQVSAVVPYNVAGKSQVQLILEYNNVQSAPVTVPVAPAAPGLFTVSGGAGQVVALQESGCCNSSTNPARRGEVLVLYATGEGQTNPPGRDGSLAEYATLAEFPRPLLPVSVLIGGQPAEILYAGAAPGFVAGLMQINLRIPATAPTGDAIPITLRVGEATSRSGVTLSLR